MCEALFHESTGPFPYRAPIEGGSRSSGSREAGAPVAFTLRQPGDSNQGEGPVGSAPESRRHWVLGRESSPVSSHA